MRLMPSEVAGRLLHLAAGAAMMVLLGTVLPCRAQQVTATLSGTVRDTTGAMVPQAALAATNVGTGVAVKTTSDPAGNYIFPSLPPATYTLSAEKGGFNTTVISGITLSVYQKATIDVVLQVGQVLQTVEVKGAAPIVSTTSASVGTLIGEQQTNDLPLNLRRTSELALLVPGVVNTSGNSLTSANGNGSGFNQTSFSSVGSTSASNLVLIDGMLNRALNNGGFALDLAPEMVKEFKIQDNCGGPTRDAAAGSLDEVKRIVAQLRERWPEVRIVLRADSGFCREALMAWCEQNYIDYVFGLARNQRLSKIIGAQMHQAHILHQTSGKAARVFTEFDYQTRKSWSCARRVVAKAEYLDKGQNPRFVVTSLTAEQWAAQDLYEKFYCARGEMENRIKEQMCLFADRLSTDEMKGNQLRLYFSALAYTLMEALRRLGLKGTEWAQAQVDTIRLKLLKIGAIIRISARRVVLAMSSAYPWKDIYAHAFHALRC